VYLTLYLIFLKAKESSVTNHPKDREGPERHRGGIQSANTYPRTAVGTLKPRWKAPTPRRPKWMKKM